LNSKKLKDCSGSIRDFTPFQRPASAIDAEIAVDIAQKVEVAKPSSTRRCGASSHHQPHHRIHKARKHLLEPAILHQSGSVSNGRSSARKLRIATCFVPRPSNPAGWCPVSATAQHHLIWIRLPTLQRFGRCIQTRYSPKPPRMSCVIERGHLCNPARKPAPCASRAKLGFGLVRFFILGGLWFFGRGVHAWGEGNKGYNGGEREGKERVIRAGPG